MPYADHARNVACDRRYRRTEHRRSSWRTYARAHQPANTRGRRLRLARRKVRIHRRDGWRCHYCDERGTRRTLTLDHKVPRKDHGSNRDENIVSACRRCNQRKGVLSYGSFVERMRAQRGLPPLWVIE